MRTFDTIAVVVQIFGIVAALASFLGITPEETRVAASAVGLILFFVGMLFQYLPEAIAEKLSRQSSDT